MRPVVKLDLIAAGVQRTLLAGAAKQTPYMSSIGKDILHCVGLSDKQKPVLSRATIVDSVEKIYIYYNYV